MILPVESKEIARRLNAYLPQFARPLLDRLIERVRYETQQEIALAQEQRRRKEEITQNVLGEAGEISPQIAARAAAMAAAWVTGYAAPPSEHMGKQAAATAAFIAEHAAEATAARIGEIRRFHAGQAAGLEEIRRQFGPYFDQIADVDGWTAAVRRGDDPTPYMHPAPRPAPLGLATATTIADARPAARRLEYDDRIAFIVEHLAGPRPDLADLEDQQRAREELIQAAEQAD